MGMYILVILIVGGLLIAGVSKTFELRRAAKMPVVSKESFLAYFPGALRDSYREELLALRSKISRALAVPEDRLHPELELLDLVERVDLSGSLRLARSDLLEDLEDELSLSGMPVDSETLEKLARTVGSYVEATLKARANRDDD